MQRVEMTEVIANEASAGDSVSCIRSPPLRGQSYVPSLRRSHRPGAPTAGFISIDWFGGSIAVIRSKPQDFQILGTVWWFVVRLDSDDRFPISHALNSLSLRRIRPSPKDGCSIQ